MSQFSEKVFTGRKQEQIPISFEIKGQPIYETIIERGIQAKQKLIREFVKILSSPGEIKNKNIRNYFLKEDGDLKFSVKEILEADEKYVYMANCCDSKSSIVLEPIFSIKQTRDKKEKRVERIGGGPFSLHSYSLLFLSKKEIVDLRRGEFASYQLQEGKDKEEAAKIALEKYPVAKKSE